MVFAARSFTSLGLLNKCKVHRESLLKATAAALFFSFLLWFLNPDGALLRVFLPSLYFHWERGSGERITQLLAICFLFFDT